MCIIEQAFEYLVKSLQRCLELPASLESQGDHINRQCLVDLAHDVIFGKHISPPTINANPYRLHLVAR